MAFVGQEGAKNNSAQMLVRKGCDARSNDPLLQALACEMARDLGNYLIIAKSGPFLPRLPPLYGPWRSGLPSAGRSLSKCQHGKNINNQTF
jgi:hypothetical protein